MKTFPIPRRLACSPVHHQLFRLLRHFRIEVVHQHPQRRFLLPSLARNRRPSRRPKRPLRQPRLLRRSRRAPRQCRTHEFPSLPLILAHATPFCTWSQNPIVGLGLLEFYLDTSSLHFFLPFSISPFPFPF